MPLLLSLLGLNSYCPFMGRPCAGAAELRGTAEWPWGGEGPPQRGRGGAGPPQRGRGGVAAAEGPWGCGVGP